MNDESSGERDIGVMKAAEKETLEEKYLNRTAFQTITFSKFEYAYYPSLSDKSAMFSDA
jgi:hypothetical protein